jgi:hypothetical protein
MVSFYSLPSLCQYQELEEPFEQAFSGAFEDTNMQLHESDIDDKVCSL